MYFFLHVLPDVVSAVLSFLVEWFLFREQPALYGGTLSPLVIAWLYTALMLAVWLLPLFYDACRRKGGMISTALNLLPAEVIFGGEFLYRLPLAGVAVLLLCGVVLWLLWYECYRRNVDAWDAGKRGVEYDMLRRRNRRVAVRIFVLITSLLLLIPSLYGIHVLRADQARTVTAFYETYYETDPSFLIDLEVSGLIGSL